jgi:multidrug efflux pump subunit AcrA (membrane-fusion protein)
MKRNYINKAIISILFVLAFSCREKSADEHNDHKTGTEAAKNAQGDQPSGNHKNANGNHQQELRIDSSLLPLLKPVNEQVVSSMPTIKAESGTRIFSVPVQGIIGFDRRKQVSISSRVAGRIERMNIKYNYQPVSKGQLIMEIYSPDLAAAQQELIYISRNDDDELLLQKAKQRLSLLGMQPAQIAQVIRSGKPLYRVPVFSSVSGYIVERNVANNSAAAPILTQQQTGSEGMNEMGGSSQGSTSSFQNQGTNQTAIQQTPVLVREGQYVSAGETIFTIYQSDNMVAEFSFIPALASEIKKGQKLVFNTVSNPDKVMTGIIGLIEPTQRNGESFNVARVYLSGTDLQPGQLLNANIPVVKTYAWWLPEKAVLRLGNQSVVFKKEQSVFIPESIKTGSTINGMVEILEDISEWQVAQNASYLVDSESFIRINSNQKK